MSDQHIATIIKRVEKGERLNRPIKAGCIGVYAPDDGILVSLDTSGVPLIYLPDGEIRKILSKNSKDGWVKIDNWAKPDEENEDGL
jgi:hypothetical protein